MTRRTGPAARVNKGHPRREAPATRAMFTLDEAERAELGAVLGLLA